MIRMKENNDKNSKCKECGCQWKNTRNMIDILLCGKVVTLCHSCYEDLFHKILTMDVRYNAKVKSKEDLLRANNERNLIIKALEVEK